MAAAKAENSHPTASISGLGFGARAWCKSTIETSRATAQPENKIARFDFVPRAAGKLKIFFDFGYNRLSLKCAADIGWRFILSAKRVSAVSKRLLEPVRCSSSAAGGWLVNGAPPFSLPGRRQHGGWSVSPRGRPS